MMSPLRVLCVTPFGPSGKGGIDRLYLYLRDLVERYGMPDVDLRFARARGSAAGNAWMASFPLILGEFAWTLARLRPHVVHINFATGGSLPRKFAILKLARLFGARVVVHFHGQFIEDKVAAGTPAGRLFKAIATGAGAVNWMSMWAQSDMQINREFYFMGKPYENREHYLEVSPIAYIENAKTPTLIFCGTADPRVPAPQSRELYMSLKNLGVPAEYIEFPGQGHGLTNPRYELVKMEAELAWFDKWINGKQEWLDWKKLLATIPQ